MKKVLDINQIKKLKDKNIELPDTTLYWARCIDNNPRAATHYGEWKLVKGKGIN